MVALLTNGSSLSLNDEELRVWDRLVSAAAQGADAVAWEIATAAAAHQGSRELRPEHLAALGQDIFEAQKWSCPPTVDDVRAMPCAVSHLEAVRAQEPPSRTAVMKRWLQEDPTLAPFEHVLLEPETFHASLVEAMLTHCSSDDDPVKQFCFPLLPTCPWLEEPMTEFIAWLDGLHWTEKDPTFQKWLEYTEYNLSLKRAAEKLCQQDWPMGPTANLCFAALGILAPEGCDGFEERSLFVDTALNEIDKPTRPHLCRPPWCKGPPVNLPNARFFVVPSPLGLSPSAVAMLGLQSFYFVALPGTQRATSNVLRTMDIDFDHELLAIERMACALSQTNEEERQEIRRRLELFAEAFPQEPESDLGQRARTETTSQILDAAKLPSFLVQAPFTEALPCDTDVVSYPLVQQILSTQHLSNVSPQCEDFHRLTKVFARIWPDDPTVSGKLLAFFGSGRFAPRKGAALV